MGTSGDRVGNVNVAPSRGDAFECLAEMTLTCRLDLWAVGKVSRYTRVTRALPVIHNIFTSTRGSYLTARSMSTEAEENKGINPDVVNRVCQV
jgi:hypothetical protein